jgi:hypothetical protein
MRTIQRLVIVGLALLQFFAICATNWHEVEGVLIVVFHLVCIEMILRDGIVEVRVWELDAKMFGEFC